MAFSLEAALVVPLVIGTWLSFSLAVVPVGERTRLAAGLEMQAAAGSLAGGHLYQATCLRDGPVWTTTLRTSPQEALELVTLLRDDYHLISSGFSGLFVGNDTAAGQDS